MKAHIRYDLMGHTMHTAYNKGGDWEKACAEHTVYMSGDKTYTDDKYIDAFVASVNDTQYASPETMLTAVGTQYAKIPREVRGYRSLYGEAIYKAFPNVCVLALKNGNVFVDSPLKVPTLDGGINYYGCCTVVLYKDKVFDPENGYYDVAISDYMQILKKNNSKLRLDTLLTYGITTTEEATAICDELRKNKALLDNGATIYDSNEERKQ